MAAVAWVYMIAMALGCWCWCWFAGLGGSRVEVCGNGSANRRKVINRVALKKVSEHNREQCHVPS